MTSDRASPITSRVIVMAVTATNANPLIGGMIAELDFEGCGW